MSFKRTFIIAVIFIIVAAAYWFDQKRIKQDETRKESESRLVAAKRDAISGVTLARKDSTIELKKLDNEWRITKPYPLRMDQAAIDSLLGEIDRAKKTSPFEHGGKLDDYGLKTPTVKAEISAASEHTSQSLELGNKTPDGTEVYVHVPNDKQVFTAPVSLETQLSKPLSELRDKRLLPTNVTDATSFSLAFGKNFYAFEKKGEDWFLSQPRNYPADNDRIGEILRQVNDTKATDFTDTSTLINLKEFGLHQPALTLTVNVPGKDKAASKYVMRVGNTMPKNRNNRYAIQDGGSYLYDVSVQLFEKMMPKWNEICSKRVLAMRGSDVGRMILTAGGKSLDVKRDSAEKWVMTGNEKTKLDSTLLNQKVNDLTSLKCLKMLDATTQTQENLKQPVLRIDLVSKDGKTTETLLTGKKDTKEDFVYAYNYQYESIFAIPTAEPGKFILAPADVLDKTMYEIEEPQVQKIELRDGEKRMTFTREKSGGWTGQTIGAKTTRQVEGAPVSTLTYAVGALNWSRTLDPKISTDQRLIKTQMLDNPPREITFYNGEGKELARLGQGTEKENNIYLRRGKDEYFAVDRLKYGSVKSAIDDLIDAMRDKK